MKKCWEFMNCPKTVAAKCPAVRTHHEMSCWRVGGTLCRGEVQGGFVQKLYNCKKCDYYAYAATQR